MGESANSRDRFQILENRRERFEAAPPEGSSMMLRTRFPKRREDGKRSARKRYQAIGRKLARKAKAAA